MKARHQKFESALKNIKSDVKVPQNLAERIKARIHAYAALIERRLILKSGGLALLALLLSLYGLGGLLSNMAASEFTLYLSALLSEPELLMSSTGFKSFIERLPLASLVIFVSGAGIFALNLKQLVRLQPHVQHHEQRT